MKWIAAGVGIMVLALALIGASNGHGAVNETGMIVLAPMNGSGVSGTATLTHGTRTYIFARAINLAGNATSGFALMTPQCAGVRQMLNPLDADNVGDGSGSSQVDGGLGDGWLGVLATNDATAQVVACGPTTNAGSTPSTPTKSTKTPPVGGGTVVPVTTPTRVPTPLPGSTPHPPGS